MEPEEQREVTSDRLYRVTISGLQIDKERIAFRPLLPFYQTCGIITFQTVKIQTQFSIWWGSYIFLQSPVSELYKITIKAIV